MNIITCVATYFGRDIIEFLKLYNECIKGDLDHKLLILQTGLDELVADSHASFFNGYYARKVLTPMHRFYASVMYEKVRFTQQFANDDTILVAIDEDYHFNPRFLKFAHQIMSENPQVDYLSLLRGPGTIVEEKDICVLSGFRFFRWGSCMGGSMIMRWKNFLPLVDGFFRKCRVSGESAGAGKMFDRVFFDFLKVVTRVEGSVYTLCDFSLVQHCRTGSNYRDDGVLSDTMHLSAINYDPRINPWDYQIPEK